MGHKRKSGKSCFLSYVRIPHLRVCPDLYLQKLFHPTLVPPVPNGPAMNSKKITPGFHLNTKMLLELFFILHVFWAQERGPPLHPGYCCKVT